MQSAARVSGRTTPYAFREVAPLAQDAQKFVSTTSRCGQDRGFLPVVQGHVNNVRREHPSVFETDASDVGPSKNLIPFRFDVRKNTNPHLGVIEVHG